MSDLNWIDDAGRVGHGWEPDDTHPTPNELAADAWELEHGDDLLDVAEDEL